MFFFGIFLQQKKYIYSKYNKKLQFLRLWLYLKVFWFKNFYIQYNFLLLPLIWNIILNAFIFSYLTTKQIETTSTTKPTIFIVTTPTLTFNCTGKTDGYYADKPCTSTFFTCVFGNSIKLLCPVTLVFDEVALTCEYPNICGTRTASQ